MAHNRRKSNGCRRGKFKPKRMGKGWASHRVKRGRPLPVDRSKSAEDEKSDRPSES